MTSSVWATAEKMLTEYGCEAEMVALHRSGLLLRLGDRAEAEFWWEISGAISSLQNKLAEPH
jgi:hypothetical protein